ncbi:MAG: hypothetical protein GY841_13595 [FCB group bacterium]|nr:hypothetical protein [FCB group bacterium]
MPTELTGLIGDFGATGILIFFVMFLIKKTLPQMVKSFQNDLKLQREFFAEQLTLEREFRRAVCEQRNMSAVTSAQKEG